LETSAADGPAGAVAPPAVRDGARYRLAAGTEWVLVGKTTAVLRSASGTANLEGPNAAAFLSEVVPLLGEACDLRGIAEASGRVPVEELQGYLRELVVTGLIEPAGEAKPRSYVVPLAEAMAAHGRAASVVEARLAEQRVAIFGLGSIGAEIAREIARWAVRKLVLIDPMPARPDDPATFAAGASRQRALAAELAARYPGLAVSEQEGDWSAEAVGAIAGDVDILIGTVDRDHAAVAHWVNRAALAHGRIAAFASVDGDTATVGPIVFPRETACYMCWRMRAIACEDDYAATMAFEEARDARRSPAAVREPTFGPAVAVAAGLLAGEVAKAVAALGRHALAGRVIQWNGMSAHWSEHEVLRQPDCPACSKKNC
jgi:bacteriocin biosynthesis cyclodehydratase domain-containing protein